MPNRLRSFTLLLLATLLIFGCDDESPTKQARDSGGAAASGTSTTSQTAMPSKVENASTEKEEKHRACDTITREDVERIFGSKLTFGRQVKHRGGASCEYQINFGIDGNALRFGISDGRNYEEYRKHGRSAKMDYRQHDGLGLDAFSLNGANLHVQVDEKTYLGFQLQLIAFGEPLPITPDEILTGLLELAEIAIQRL